MWQQFVADFWWLTDLGLWALTEHTLMTLYLAFVGNQLLMPPELTVTGWLIDGGRWVARKVRRPQPLDWCGRD